MEKVFLNKATAMYILGYGTSDESRFDDLMLLAGLTPIPANNEHGEDWADAIWEWVDSQAAYTKLLEKSLK